MQSSATAGIEFHGAVMRYSEIERFGSQYRLLRLGDCDFEFDVTQALFSDGEDKYLDVVSDALSEIFFGSSATRCRIAVHAPWARYFQSWSDKQTASGSSPEHLGFESALLFDEYVSPENRAIVGSAVRTLADGIAAASLQVAELSPRIVARVLKTTTGLGDMAVDVIPGSEAAVTILRERGRLAAAGCELAVGLHDALTEYIVMKGSDCAFYQGRNETAAGDVAYFALHSLKCAGLGPGEVHRISVYGSGRSAGNLDVLKSVFGERVGKVNAIELLDLDPGRFEEGFPFESFALCLGAAL